MFKFKKKIAGIPAALITAAMLVQPAAVMAANTKPYVALGADLDSAQRAEVLSLLGLTEADLQNNTVVTVTNAEEHQYLDGYVASSVIGSRALSSCKVVESSKSGITVETHNITYVTPGMYQNALATAGMKNAEVIVAGPSQISGTAALVGAMKAYEQMYGKPVDQQRVDGATNELVTTGEIADAIGDPRKAAELIAAVKQIVVQNDMTSETDIRNAIIDVSNQLQISLTEEEVNDIIALMKKLASLDIDVDALVEQARSMYEELKNSGIDLSEYGITDEDVNGFLAFFKGLWQTIKSIFS